MRTNATYRRPDADKVHRVIVLMTPAELNALDDWGVASRMSSRAEAVRRLIEKGLRASDSGARNDDADEAVACRRNLVGVGNPVSGGPSEYET